MDKSTEKSHSSQGKPLPDIVRHQVVRLHLQGRSQRSIATVLDISKSTVGNIVSNYSETGEENRPLSQKCRGRERQKLDVETMKAIELYKIAKPSIYAKEIRSKLVEDNVCTYQNLPSIRYINMGLHEIGYTYKKLTSVPTESQTPNCQARYDDFLSYISDMDAHSIHFFDESSVIKTTGKRKYGSGEVGKRAIEIQPYASNVTFTINLLHSTRGIDIFNIIEGPSNGQELLHFFTEALDAKHGDGSFKLCNGDIVVMDNCRFHHGRNTEPQLRAMLANRNVSLVFQPPYHPQLNTCEYCFSQLKSYLKEHERYALEFTEMAICDGLLERITAQFSYGVFKYCGYLK